MQRPSPASQAREYTRLNLDNFERAPCPSQCASAARIISSLHCVRLAATLLRAFPRVFQKKFRLQCAKLALKAPAGRRRGCDIPRGELLWRREMQRSLSALRKK